MLCVDTARAPRVGWGASVRPDTFQQALQQTLKFIHTADLHLDSPLRGLARYPGAPVDEIRGATRRAFENLVRLATSEPADLVVIAGDVYDGDWRDYQTGLFFAAQLSRLREAQQLARIGKITSPVSRNGTGCPVARSVARTPSGVSISSKRYFLSSRLRNAAMRSLPTSPSRQRLQRATSLKRIAQPILPIVSRSVPLA